MIVPRSFRSLRFVSACIVLVFLVGCLLAVRHIGREESKADREYKLRQAQLNGRLKAGAEAPRPGLDPVRHHRPDGNASSSLRRPHPAPEVRQGGNPGGAPTPAAVDAADNDDSRTEDDDPGPPSYDVHAFYYPWYGSPEFDGRYLHWDHKRLPHWDPKIARKFDQEAHRPPEDIGASFYPELGCYSSRDPKVIESHMLQLRAARIGVLVLSWYPPNKSDDAGFPSDNIVPLLLDACHKHDIKLAFHSEPYKNRTEMTFLRDLRYIHDTYGSHPALYRLRSGERDLPLVYLYDSYLTSSRAWARILKKGAPASIRGTPYDALVLGLYVEQRHNNDLLVGGFDGFYTYFAANKFSFGSRWANWRFLAQFARRNDMLFVPSVGPGYDDTQVRPWNGLNTHPRRGGDYYRESFAAALQHAPPLVSITSFNEWHEGSQIERAAPRPGRLPRYHDYLPYGRDHYLTLTRQMVEHYRPQR